MANADDYTLARHLLAKPLARLLGGQLSDPARRYYQRVSERVNVGDEFTTREEAIRETFSRRAVTGWLCELSDGGVVEQLEQSKGNKPARWRLTEITPDDATVDGSELPKVEDVFTES